MPTYSVQYYETKPLDLKTIEITEESAVKAKDAAMDRLDRRLDVGHYTIAKIIETKS
ncbi:hypothetical protein [Domibacillus indicus]|uniref:hypothetical protein n=1 Tax=Domibacillus indicus TaxID=1437523 RepID=UPI0012E02CEB|nr:hypothetical protein [Domibacillus indicus]